MRIVSFVEGLLLLIGSPGHQYVAELGMDSGKIDYQRNGLFEDDTDVAGSGIGKRV